MGASGSRHLVGGGVVASSLGRGIVDQGNHSLRSAPASGSFQKDDPKTLISEELVATPTWRRRRHEKS